MAYEHRPQHYLHHQQPPPTAAVEAGGGGGSALQFLNSPFGDTTFTKVFVGGLAWETRSDTLRRYFEHFGDILEAVVIADKNTGRSKGYGFVSIVLIHLYFFLGLLQFGCGFNLIYCLYRLWRLGDIP